MRKSLLPHALAISLVLSSFTLARPMAGVDLRDLVAKSEAILVARVASVTREEHSTRPLPQGMTGWDVARLERAQGA